jgi:hypothetical protein
VHWERVEERGSNCGSGFLSGKVDKGLFERREVRRESGAMCGLRAGRVVRDEAGEELVTDMEATRADRTRQRRVGRGRHGPATLNPQQFPCAL